MAKRKAGTGRKATTDARSRKKGAARRSLREIALADGRLVLEESRAVVTTSRGVTVECLPVLTFIEQQKESIRASIDWPERPTRILRDVAGTEIERPLTQAYVESQGATEEQKQEWADYLLAQAEAQVAFDERQGTAITRLLALRGVRLVDKSLPEKWAADHEWLDIAVPEDERERTAHFFRSEILGNADDVQLLMLGIAYVSGADEEVLSIVEASFRGDLEQPGGPDADRGAPDSGAPQPQAADTELVEQASLFAGQGEGGAEPDAGPVGGDEPAGEV